MQGQCVDPKAVQDWELQAYLHGDAGPHVARHLKACAFCRARLAEMGLSERRWRQALHRFDCPDPDTLRDYAWGFLSPEQREQVQAHLAQCPPCSAELAELEALLEVEHKSSLENTLARARRLAQEARLTIARLLSPADFQLAPALRGETQEVLLFVPEQHGDLAPEQHGGLDADGLALSVNLEREETGTFTLFGQLLSTQKPLPPGGYARLTQRERQTEPVRASLDAHGGFALPNVLPGVYQLVVDLGVQRIVVPDLSLGKPVDP